MQKRFNFWLLLISLLSSASAEAKPGSNATMKDTLFINATIDNRTPYVGQEVVLTYSLYFKTFAPRIADSGKADHPGLWVQEVTPDGYIKSTPTTEGGMNLRKAVIKQLKLIPMQPGKLSVSNYRLRCYLPASTGEGVENARDIETVITAPTTSIDARPLPKSAPAEFSGAVGDFALTLSSDNFRLHVGKPLTISVTISGKGNLNAFPQVALSFPAGFRLLEKSVPTAGNKNAGQEEKTISSKISLNPERSGTFKFTPVRLCAFNPLTGRYETISSGEITVTVLPAAMSPNGTAQTAIPTLPTNRTGWIPPTAIISMSAAVLLVLAVLFALSSRHRKKVDIQPKKSPEPSQRPASPAPNSAEALREKVYEALRKTGVPNPSGLTSQQLLKTLAGLKIKPACSEALLELLKMIDHAVYTPGETSKQALSELSSKTDTVLEALSRNCTN